MIGKFQVSIITETYLIRQYVITIFIKKEQHHVIFEYYKSSKNLLKM